MSVKLYLAIRLLLGAGLFIALFAGLVLHTGVDEVAEAVDLDLVDLVYFIGGGVFGAVWEQVIAAGVAHWIVFGTFKTGPPSLRASPRPMFA